MASDRVLSFVAAGLPLVTPISSVDRVVEEATVMRLPFAGPGLVGLLVDDEEPVALYDLDAFASDRAGGLRDGDFVLAAIMLCPQGKLALQLDRLVGLPAMGQPLPGSESAVAALPEPLQPCIGGATLLEGLLAFFFAPDLFAELLLQAR